MDKFSRRHFSPCILLLAGAKAPIIFEWMAARLKVVPRYKASSVVEGPVVSFGSASGPGWVLGFFGGLGNHSGRSLKTYFGVGSVAEWLVDGCSAATERDGGFACKID